MKKTTARKMSSSTAVRDLQRDLENKANDLGKIQKGRFFRFFSPFLIFFFCFWRRETLLFSCVHISDIAKNHQLRKKYTIQLGENELVLKVYVYVSLFNLGFVVTSMVKISDTWNWKKIVLIALLGFLFLFYHIRPGLIFLYVCFVFTGVGFAGRRCKRLQIDWSGASEAGFGWSKCKCPQTNWVHLCWIVSFLSFTWIEANVVQWATHFLNVGLVVDNKEAFFLG